MAVPDAGEARELAFRRALLTGASSAMGAELARVLAGRGCNLVLVARRAEPLRPLARRLRRRHGVEVDVVALNLATEGAPRSLHRRLKKRGKPVDILVNSASFGVWGSFLDIPWERERGMLQLDVVSAVHLTRLFASDMMARGFGRILQVASVAPFQPTPLHATYAAARSFVLSFSEAVHRELSGTGVTCTALCPGTVAAQWLEGAGQSSQGLYRRLLVMQGPAMARLGVEAMLAGRPTVAPDRLDSLAAAPRTAQELPEPRPGGYRADDCRP
jgi:uncharacterized protein